MLVASTSAAGAAVGTQTFLELCCLSHSFTLVRRALLGEIEITPQRFGLRYMPAAYVSDATLLLDEKKAILRQMKPLMAELRKKRVGQCVCDGDTWLSTKLST